MSVGSLGQFVFLPGSHALIASVGWSESLMVLAAMSLVMLPLSAALMEPNVEKSQKALPLKPILDEAIRHRGFWLLSLGFFVCGFHVVFIGTHLPAFLSDGGLESVQLRILG